MRDTRSVTQIWEKLYQMQNVTSTQRWKMNLQFSKRRFPFVSRIKKFQIATNFQDIKLTSSRLRHQTAVVRFLVIQKVTVQELVHKRGRLITKSWKLWI